MWVLVASHCLLETLPGFDFLRCSAEAQTCPDENHGCDESCCGVESAGFQAQRYQDFVPTCDFVIIPSDIAVDFERSLPPEVRIGILTAAPPEFCKTWQFLCRTALPVRAPSLTS
jgi:hypothetical protein